MANVFFWFLRYFDNTEFLLVNIGRPLLLYEATYYTAQLETYLILWNIADPLGICAPPQASNIMPPQVHHTPAPIAPAPVAKRRASEEMVGGPQAKKFILAGPWDLDVPTNVVIFERVPCPYMHSHPEVNSFTS